jgi:sulfate adenylyltransferase
MADLIPPHGGLSEPVSCMVAPGDEAKVRAEAAGLVQVPVSDADLSSVYRFGDGALSPLTGPMGKAAYDRVLDESVIEHNGKKYAWTIPIAFPVTAELAKQIKAGQKVALANSGGTVVATLDVSDVFEWDKMRYLKSVYGTERTDHPGADMVLKGDADKTHLIGGTIHVSASTSSRRRKCARCSRQRAGSASSRSRRATRCTAPTSMRSCTVSRRCSVRATTPARASTR